MQLIVYDRIVTGMHGRRPGGWILSAVAKLLGVHGSLVRISHFERRLPFDNGSMRHTTANVKGGYQKQDSEYNDRNGDPEYDRTHAA